ncbi:MAG: hypothetical protein M3Z15_04290 [Pseudomonadota bacterium]|nr:hypothetical protein [Pseudomonadota bacterium]
MSHAMRIVIIGVATLAALCASPGAAAGEEGLAVAAAAAPAEGTAAVAPARPLLFGVKPVDLKVLARKRGGADVINDMQLKGVVADNRAINVTTGNNFITDGAFANTSGLPLVVQNTGNNVLIQNATIVNVQVK